MSEILSFDNLIFSELRIIPIVANSDTITDANMVKAITANEEIKQLGYTLKPVDIVKLTMSKELDNFVSNFRTLVGEVKAKPMYPNFPTQVMNMDEATFRFHQLAHYFSTYGIEDIFGIEVSKGWLPDVEDTEKTVDDTTLLSAKTVELYDQRGIDNIYSHVYKIILSKRERMTDKDRLIIAECLKHLAPYQISTVEVTFKQNLIPVFYSIFTSDVDTSMKLSALHSICQHTGDVWKCVDYTLTRSKFHFKTSQKRLIVKLLESYTVSDFKSNLILSNKKGKRTNLMLQYIDYNMYGRSDDHIEAVKAFRNGDLRSWESRAKYLVETHNANALDFVAQHPGTMLRMLTYLIRDGYNFTDIYPKLKSAVANLSTQTLVSICNSFGKMGKDWGERTKEVATVYAIVRALLIDKFSVINTPLKDKKVYIDMSEYVLDYSIIQTNDKSAEGGYIRSGIAYKIPETVSRLRFFIYWNDSSRVDIDLHGAVVHDNGYESAIGWNGAYLDGNDVVFSGDVTHSDAAEYIDINLDSDISKVTANINLFSGYDTFKEIDECYVGCMAVNSLDEEVKLYNPKNCFFTHYITSAVRTMNYGFVDVQHRYIVFDGAKADGNDYYSIKERYEPIFSLNDYIYNLVTKQNCTVVDNADDADVVLVMAKPNNDKEISLIDNNFFMDY